MAAHSAINLLPKTEFELSFWGKFLKWSLSAGRYAIILTELVVIVAFLSRFKLDQDLLDLSDRIEGQTAILEATASTEANFLSAQNRLARAQQLLQSQISSSAVLDKVVSLLPPGVTLTQLAISPQEITLETAIQSEQALGVLINQARAQREWQTVSLTSITATAEQGIIATIIITL